MKKIRFLLLMLLAPLLGLAQTYTGTATTWSQNKGKIGADKGIVFTFSDTIDHSVPYGTVRLNSSDTSLYVFNGANWIKTIRIASSSGGGSNYTFIGPLSVSNDTVSINLSSYATTSALTSGLATKQNTLGYTAESTGNKTTDANGTSNSLYPTQGAVKSYVESAIAALPSIAGKVNYTDTPAMLSPYLRSSLGVKYVDTSAMLGGYLRKADTASMLAPYAFKSSQFWYHLDDTTRNDSTNLLMQNVSTTINSIDLSIQNFTTTIDAENGFTLNAPSGNADITANAVNVTSTLDLSLLGGSSTCVLNDNGLVVPIYDADPTGESASIYYNNTDDKFRAFENGAWADMIGGSSVSAASVSDINTGTDNTTFASPLGLEGSKYAEQDGAKNYAVTTGTATAYVLATTPSFTPVTGTVIYVKFHLANTGAATINVNGVGAVALQKDLSTALVANDIPINSEYTIRRTSTGWLVTDLGFAGINLSARLSGALSDETGTGVAVFGTSPTFTTSVVGGTTFAAFNTASTNLSLGGAATTYTEGGTPTTALTATYFGNATASGATKTLNYGTGGASGSTTAINIGSATSGATTNTKLNITPASDATGDLFYRNASGFLTRLGIGSTGQVLTVAAGLPSWATGGGGGSYWEFGTTGNVISSNQIFGSTTGSSGTYNIDFRLKDEILMRLGRKATGERFGYFMSRGTSVNNYDSWWVGGEANSATGIRAGGINGVGGTSTGTGSLSINGGQAQANNAISAMSTSTYANGDNSTAWGGYANNANFTGCFNWADFSETSFSNNTANNQFKVKAAGNAIITDKAASIAYKPNAMLEVNSNSKGILPTRLTNAQKTAVTWTIADDGMIIYCTDCLDASSNAGVLQVYQHSTTSWKNAF